MSDYERGIRDAIAFMHSHTLASKMTSAGEYQTIVKPASAAMLAWEGTSAAKDTWTEAAVSSLVKEVAA